MLQTVCHNHSVSPVKLALFDLDNTLFDRASHYRAWAESWVESVGLGPAEVEWFCEMDEDGYADRRTVWINAKAKFGLPESVDDLMASQRSAYLDTCRPNDTVLEALVSLRLSGWRIGIVTNGAMPHQAEKADRLGLLSVVDVFCGSGELGVEKPNRRIFEEAIQRCTGGEAFDREACWMVGDAPIPDISGGRAVGLRTIWLHRGRKWNPSDGDPPDVVVGSLVDAVQEILSHPR